MLFTLLAGSASQAQVLTLYPASQTVGLGGTVSVEVRISGLAAGQAPSLGGFNFDLHYDNSKLSFRSIDFGDPRLGDQLDFGQGSSYSADTTTAGIVRQLGISFALADVLDPQQAADFTLSTVTFSGVAQGTALLSFADVFLSDADALDLPVTLPPDTNPPTTLSITVVPEPRDYVMVSGLLCGAGALILRRSRHSMR